MRIHQPDVSVTHRAFSGLSRRSAAHEEFAAMRSRTRAAAEQRFEREARRRLSRAALVVGLLLALLAVLLAGCAP